MEQLSQCLVRLFLSASKRDMGDEFFVFLLICFLLLEEPCPR